MVFDPTKFISVFRVSDAVIDAKCLTPRCGVFVSEVPILILSAKRPQKMRAFFCGALILRKNAS